MTKKSESNLTTGLTGKQIAWAAAGLGIAAFGAYQFYHWRRRRIAPPLSGGMSVGHDSSSINPDSRYHDEGEQERDVVDQASMESMIASDPPAY